MTKPKRLTFTEDFKKDAVRLIATSGGYFRGLPKTLVLSFQAYRARSSSIPPHHL